MASSSKLPLLAAACMVKNEHLRIAVTLKSIFEPKAVDCLVIFDTGSTDDTIEIITAECKRVGIPLHLKTGVFIDFSTSRNELLEFAKDKAHYLLLLDCNDELRGGAALRKFCTAKLKDIKSDAFLMKQEWRFSGDLLDNYENIRLLKANRNWRYKGVVHEYLENPNKVNSKLELTPGVVIYQDRTQDDDKSAKRFFRDVKLLKKEVQKSPDDARSHFYLALSYKWTNRYEKAIYWSEKRYAMGYGFWEERYNCLYNIGECYHNLYWKDREQDLSKANEHWGNAEKFYLQAFNIYKRAEPLVHIAEFYHKQTIDNTNKEPFIKMYKVLKMATEIPYPTHCTLFVLSTVYNYQRWHLLGIVSWYLGALRDGEQACLKALEARPNSQVDKDNLAIYRAGLENFSL